MKKSAIETIVGLIVIIIAFSFVFFTYKSGIFVSFDGEESLIKAEFEKADGIEVGSSVKLSGVKIGFVSKVGLNLSNYNAEIEMKVKSSVMLPVDTSASIIGMGFIGEKYIMLSPGAESQYLANGGSIDFTQSSVSLESLIGKFMFGAANDSSEDKLKSMLDSESLISDDSEIESKDQEFEQHQNNEPDPDERDPNHEGDKEMNNK